MELMLALAEDQILPQLLSCSEEARSHHCDFPLCYFLVLRLLTTTVLTPHAGNQFHLSISKKVDGNYLSF